MTNTILEILENNHPRIKDNMKSAKEIADMMKEFIEWKDDLQRTGTIFYNLDKSYSYGDDDLNIENLFNYWYGNIYKK